MYKILLLIRKDDKKPLYTIYKTEQEVTVSDVIETQLLDWSCTTLAELEAKVDELLNTYPITDIVPIKIVGIDAIVSATDGE